MLYSEEFHQVSKKHGVGRGNLEGLPDRGHEELQTVRYKVYLDVPEISLEKSHLDGNLGETISRRKSKRDFSHISLTQKEISTLLAYSCGLWSQGVVGASEEGGESHRAHPSAGARYPIETYLFNFIGGEIPAGIYHYNVKRHALSVLEERTFTPFDINQRFDYEWTEKASCALVFTSIFRRNQFKYGERGYRYILIEAGHIGQNVTLVAEALDLKTYMMGGTFDSSLEKDLDIDGVSESIIYGAIIGK